MSTAETTHAPAVEPRRRDVSGSTIAGRLAGAVGVVLILTSPLTYLIGGTLGALFWGKLIFGIAAVVTYLVTNSDALGRVAGSRSTSLSALTVASVIVVLGCLVGLNFVVAKHPKEFDLTREGIFTLSEQTTGVLQRLPQAVKVYAFFPEGDRDYGPVKDTLGRYAAVSPSFTYEMVSPNNRPDLVERFHLTQDGPRVVVVSGDNDARVKDVSEEGLTNALISVTRGAPKVVYFLTGHGERDTSDKDKASGLQLTAEAVRAEGYEVKTLNLLREGAGQAAAGTVALDAAAPKGELSVPTDAAVLVIAGPRGKLVVPEVAAVENYLNRGGRVIALLDPGATGGLDGLLKQYKIALGNDLVVDANPVNQILGYGPAGVLLKPLGEHPAIADMAAPALFWMGSSLAVLDGGEAGVVATPLLTTGDTAWGETDLQGGTASRDDKDVQGPVTMAAVATRPTNAVDVKATPEARLFVASDSDWVDNQYRAVQGNGDLFLNVVDWLAEEDSKISIRPKTRAASQLLLTGEQMNTLVFASMDVLPVLLIALGSAIVLLRRQR